MSQLKKGSQKQLLSVADSKEDKKQPKFKLVREGNYKLKSTLTVSKEKLPIIDLTKE